MLAIVPPAGSCHISHRQNLQISFLLSSTRLIVNLNSPSPLTFHFSPAVYYTSVCANFLGKGGYGMSVKTQVLSALDAARGRYISGQELADQLGVSRAAIWKAVTALRADGTPIEAITNRGYALPHGADLLNADAITALLAPAVAQAVQITVVDRLPGTNAALRTQAANGAPEGLVLIAQAQSAGRGRRGHSFFSPPGGLYLSILLRPAFSTRQSPADHRIGRSCRCPCSGAVVRHAHPDQMGERPVEERQKGLRYSDRSRRGPGIRHAGLCRAGAWFQPGSAVRRLAQGACRGGGFSV